MPTTNDGQNAVNVFGSLTNFAETIIGIGIAREYGKLLEQGLTPSQAASALKNSPDMIHGAKMLGPIGITAASLAAVSDAVFNGGEPSDFIEAAVGIIAGVAGAALGAAFAIAIGASPIGWLGLALGALGGFVFSEAAVGLLPQSWLDALDNLDLDLHVPDWLDDLGNIFNPLPIDPLVIDLDGDGIELTTLEGSNAYFDLDGDNFAERTAWVAPDDGLLAVDTNGNGTIDDITEVFGSEAETGYEQLALYDTNGDGAVNADDDGFSSLLIWQDANGNGVSDAGELQTLTEAGITQLNLDVTETDITINGNQVIEKSTVEFSDGTTTESGEVLFELSQSDTQANVPDDVNVSAAINTLPFLRGFGVVSDLNIALAQNSGLVTTVETLIGAARAGEFDNFDAAFDGFLGQWGGVDEDTIWLGDAYHLTARLLYDLDDLDPNWAPIPPSINSIPDIPPPPPVAGVIFAVASNDGFLDEYGELQNPDQRAQEEQWLIERGLGIPATGNGQEEAPLILKLLENGETYVPPPSFSIGGGGGTITIELPPASFVGDITEDEDDELFPVPDFDAKKFAFLQNVLGQDYNVGGDYRAPDHVILGNPSEDVLVEIRESYGDLRSYMTARFLVESAWTVILQEGTDADLGALEPFSILSVNPFTDTIEGNGATFVKNLVDAFRIDGLGTDADALEVLVNFENDIENLGELVIGLFEDINIELVAQYFDVGNVVDGTINADVLTLNQDGVIIGKSGDDQLQSDSGTSILFGGAGDDTLTGNTAQNTYVYSNGDGNDIIIDYGQTYDPSQDKLVFADINPSDVTFSQNIERDLILTLPDDSTITVKNHFNSYNEELELIEFADGTIFTLFDIEQALQSTGNDVFYGWGKSDTFYIKAGHGNDQIIEDSSRYQEIDTLQFSEGITAADVYSTYNGASLVIGFKNAEGTVAILHDADDDSDADDHQINRFTFTDGTSFTREEFMVATLGTAGNDTFDGSGENDTFIIRAGQGDDTLSMNSYHYQEVDTLTFEDSVTAADVYSTYNGTSLVIGFNNAEGTLSILNDADDDSSAYDHHINQFTFSDGTSLSRSEFLAATAGTLGDDIFNGSGRSDTYTIGAGQGDDTITLNSSNYLEVDKLLFEDGLTLDDTYVVYDGANLVIRFANTEGSVTIVNGGPNISNGHKYQFNEYVFADGTSLNHEDFAVSGLRNALNYVPAADDTFIGTIYNDTYYVTVNHGDDTINSNSARYQEVDTVEFQEGITVADVYSTYDGVNLVVGFKAADGTITILHDGDNDSYADKHQINRFTFEMGLHSPVKNLWSQRLELQAMIPLMALVRTTHLLSVLAKVMIR